MTSGRRRARFGLLMAVGLSHATSACLVDRSLKNRCQDQSDCAAGRRCVGGVCQAGSITPPDAIVESPIGDGGPPSSDRMQEVSDAPREPVAIVEGGTTIDVGGGADSVPAGTPNTVFVTSRSYPPNFGSLEAADRYCNLAALAGGLTGVFRAWLSTSAMDARDRLQGARGWVRPDGLPFADTVDDIVRGRTFYPPSIDELGHRVVMNPLITDNVATGTTEFGVLSPESNCHDWEYGFGGAAVQAGYPDSSAGMWTAGTMGPCDQAARLYCFGVDRVAAVAPAPAPAGSRLAFVSTGRFAPSQGVSAADALCNAEAAGAGLAGTFSALLATTTAPASARFPSAATWMRPDGVSLNAVGSDMFQAGPSATINVTARGSYGAITGVLTGAEAATALAQSSQNCVDWTDSSTLAYGSAGVSTSVSGWFSNSGIDACNYPLPIYCLQN